MAEKKLNSPLPGVGEGIDIIANLLKNLPQPS
jgi:hypothetical protein